jgi:hypothetical protein
MVIAEVGSNNYEASTLGIVSSEYQKEYSRIHQYSQISTKWEENKINPTDVL